MPPPRILVQFEHEDRGEWYAHAHLRNKGGYIYLCWRERGRVRNYYLGKAPRCFT